MLGDSVHGQILGQFAQMRIGGQAGLAVRRRSARREIARGSYPAAPAATTDACERHMSGAPDAPDGPLGSTRITEPEVAARNRRARFPAAHCSGVLRIASDGQPRSPAAPSSCSSRSRLPRALMNHAMREFERLWRLRRRHAHIDALLRPRDGAWDLRFTRNERVLLTQEFPDRESACAAAEARLRELQRAGWTTHW